MANGFAVTRTGLAMGPHMGIIGPTALTTLVRTTSLIHTTRTRTNNTATATIRTTCTHTPTYIHTTTCIRTTIRRILRTGSNTSTIHCTITAKRRVAAKF